MPWLRTDSMWPGLGAIRRKECPASLREWLRKPHQNITHTLWSLFPCGKQNSALGRGAASHTQWESSAHIKETLAPPAGQVRRALPEVAVRVCVCARACACVWPT